MADRLPIAFTCPHCNSAQSRVIYGQGAVNGDIARRVRECLICHGRFTTKEMLEATQQAFEADTNPENKY